MQTIADELQKVERELSSVSQEHQHVQSSQQLHTGVCLWYHEYVYMPQYPHIVKIFAGQQTTEQLIEARRLLESAQLLERKKQQLQFQHQQLHLKLQQAKEAHAMEQELKKSIQLKEFEQLPRSVPIKMVLRKR